MSTFEDCQKFLNFVAECFVEKPVTVDQVRLQKLRTATAACGNLNEDPPIKVPNAEIDKVDEKEKPKDASRRGFVHRESNSHRGAYTLTNIYIYPIKSCGAHEVWSFPKPFFLSLISVSPCVLIRSCAALHSGPRLAGGATGFTLRQKLDGGEWKRRVPQSEESAAFMPHSPTSPPALKQITPAGVRLDKLLVAHWKNMALRQNVFPSMNCHLQGFVFFFVALQEWKPFQFPWNTTPRCRHATKHVRAKFVVTGELARLKHAAGSCWRRLWDISVVLFVTRQTAFLQWTVVHDLLSVSFEFLLLFTISIKDNNVRVMIKVPTDKSHKLQKTCSSSGYWIRCHSK